MIQILKANLIRLFKNWLYLGGLVVAAVLTYYISRADMELFVLHHINHNECMKLISGAVYAFIAIFVPVFEGTEFSDGTIRNKFIMGHSADEFYLAHLLTSFLMMVVMEAVWFVSGLLAGARVDADLLAFSGHKLGGPMGIGVLWGKADILDKMPPFLTGGEMIDSVTEQAAVWAPVPQKFEAGTQDAAGIYATGAAITYLEDHDFAALETRERKLARYLTEKLEELPFIEMVGPASPDRHVSAVSFNVKGIHPHDVASLLDMRNVCIRAGHHCAQPLLTSMGISSCCRASVAFYNEKKDIDQLIDALTFVWQVFHGSN